MDNAAVSVTRGASHDGGEQLLGMFADRADLRSALYATLELCRHPRSSEEVDDTVGGLIPGSSVCDPRVLRHWLESSGGLERVRIGQPTDDSLDDRGPDQTVGGRKGRSPAFLWCTTPTGCQVLETMSPSRLLHDLLSREGDRRGAYLQILHFCLEPRTKQEIDDLLIDHPTLQTPRIYAAHLVRQLEEVGAIEWKGTWGTTQIGANAIES